MIWLEFCKTAMVKQKIVAKREKEQNWTHFCDILQKFSRKLGFLNEF
jgi:hypothetical protein